MIKKITKTADIPTTLIRLVVGLIFLSEGLQKFITPDATGAGRFARIGFNNPVFWANIVGGFEIACGILILLGLLTRLAAVPLLIIMIVAFVSTKIPTLIEEGFWSFTHSYRTDFAMTMLLIYLLMYGGGRMSIDRRLSNHSLR